MAIPSTVRPNDEFNERSRVLASVYFYNTSLVGNVPATMHYNLRCRTTGAVLKDWTAITPATSVQIAIPASLNVIQNDANSEEVKVLTVSANKDLDNEVTQERAYVLKNLDGR